MICLKGPIIHQIVICRVAFLLLVLFPLLATTFLLDMIILMFYFCYLSRTTSWVQEMDTGAKIFVAGHRGLVGAAIVRALNKQGYNNLVLKTHKELDLTRQADVEDFFHSEKPDYVILAAAKVGGIHANSTYPAEFIAVNLQIQTNVIDAAYRAGVKKLLFLGSSCIYPKHAQVPIVEDSLLTGPLEPTNEWYAVAKIAGIKMCQVCIFFDLFPSQRWYCRCSLFMNNIMF